MHKFSIIVPTMWRYEPFIEFLETLCKIDQIDEVLIINNDAQKLEERGWLTGRSVLYSKKIRLLGDGTNLGCNQGWNLGASEAKSEILCFMNDDIIWDVRALYRIQDHLSNDMPLIGMSAGDPVHKQHPITDGKIDITKWEHGQHTHGFGMLFFTLKSWWVPIPKDLFLYYGDNWIFDTTMMRGKPVHLVTNMMYKTPFAVTSSEFGSSEILYKEHKIYYTELEQWKKTL